MIPIDVLMQVYDNNLGMNYIVFEGITYMFYYNHNENNYRFYKQTTRTIDEVKKYGTD